MNAIERTRAAAIEHLRANDQKQREDAEEIFAAIEAGRLDALSIVQTFLAFGEAERLIERERAAAIAENWPLVPSRNAYTTREDIGQAIREGSDQ